MIKNKDGTYNKFRLIIISLIFIIMISIIGTYIIQNAELPIIKFPTFTLWTSTPTPTPTPTLTPTPTPIILTNINSSWATISSGGDEGARVSYNGSLYYVVGGGGGGSSYIVKYR